MLERRYTVVFAACDQVRFHDFAIEQQVLAIADHAVEILLGQRPCEGLFHDRFQHFHAAQENRCLVSQTKALERDDLIALQPFNLFAVVFEEVIVEDVNLLRLRDRLGRVGIGQGPVKALCLSEPIFPWHLFQIECRLRAERHHNRTRRVVRIGEGSKAPHRGARKGHGFETRKELAIP